MRYPVFLICLASSYVHSALKPMADESMANVGGQAGITLEQSTLFNLGEIKYSDDGNELKIENVRSSGQGDPDSYASSKYVIDITQSGA